MKALLTAFSLFLLVNGFSQDIKHIEQKLAAAFDKITYWQFYVPHGDLARCDSLEKANRNFRKLLLKYTAANPQTLTYNFTNLVDSGLDITTSEDGLFRIYSWDTWTGGTMHIFENVFQYKANGKVFSRASCNNSDNEFSEPGCFYTQINDIVTDSQTYYVTQSHSRWSTGLTYHNIQVFSIDSLHLNDKAKLIKTKTGIRSQLGYEVDLTASSNRGRRDIPEFYIEYDKSNKIIAIPLILGDSRVTSRKIRYQFTGQYFEKMP